MKYLLLCYVLMTSLLCSCGGGSIGTGTGLPPVKSLVNGLAEPDSELEDELDFINRLLGIDKPITIQISVLGECSKYFEKVDDDILKRNSVLPTTRLQECQAMISVDPLPYQVGKGSFAAYTATCKKPTVWEHYSKGKVSSSGHAILKLPAIDSPELCRMRVDFTDDANVRGAYIHLKASSN